MRSSLKNQPQFDGVTSYCNKSFNLVNQKGPENLETVLRNLNKTGPMLGTSMFGKKRRSRHKKIKSKSKHRSKRRSKHRHGSRKRYFGKAPFLEGKLSTSVQTEGLPLGAKSPTSIYQTFPNIFRQGSALPRPYGPRDNLRMQSLYDIRGFGHRRSKKKCKCGKKHSRHKSRSRRHKRKSKKSRKFGNSTTPGSSEWLRDASARNKVSSYMNQYANAGSLSMAKGWTPPSALYMRNSSSNVPNVIGMPNEPAQFTNNQMNSPILLHFGAKKHKANKKKSPPSLTKNKKTFKVNTKYTKQNVRSIKRSRNFGPLIPTVAGPNTVGYQTSIPLYHAGGNTIDFATNKLFRPNIVGSIGKVQSDGMTPRAWLTQSSGIGDGLGNKYRFGKKAFGGSVITLNGSGQIQISKS
jgi:hypothetical protein